AVGSSAGAKIPPLVEAIHDRGVARQTKRVIGAQAIAAADEAVEKTGVEAFLFVRQPPGIAHRSVDRRGIAADIITGGSVGVDGAEIPKVRVGMVRRDGAGVRVTARQRGQLTVVSAGGRL